MLANGYLPSVGRPVEIGPQTAFVVVLHWMTFFDVWLQLVADAVVVYVPLCASPSASASYTLRWDCEGHRTCAAFLPALATAAGTIPPPAAG